MCLLQAQGAPSLFSVIDAGHLQLGSSSKISSKYHKISVILIMLVVSNIVYFP